MAAGGRRPPLPSPRTPLPSRSPPLALPSARTPLPSRSPPLALPSTRRSPPPAAPLHPPLPSTRRSPPPAAPLHPPLPSTRRSPPPAAPLHPPLPPPPAAPLHPHSPPPALPSTRTPLPSHSPPPAAPLPSHSPPLARPAVTARRAASHRSWSKERRYTSLSRPAAGRRASARPRRDLIPIAAPAGRDSIPPAAGRPGSEKGACRSFVATRAGRQARSPPPAPRAGSSSPIRCRTRPRP